LAGEGSADWPRGLACDTVVPIGPVLYPLLCEIGIHPPSRTPALAMYTSWWVPFACVRSRARARRSLCVSALRGSSHLARSAKRCLALVCAAAGFATGRTKELCGESHRQWLESDSSGAERFPEEDPPALQVDHSYWYALVVLVPGRGSTLKHTCRAPTYAQIS